jgi:photosystem II stability/assembly factor-like uncharacterized protein
MGGRRYPLDDFETDDMFFAVLDTGWLATTKSIHRTDDGGSTSREQRLPGSKVLIRSLWFVNDKDGWAAGSRELGRVSRVESILLHTTYGGDTWDRSGVVARQASFERVYFNDLPDGWLIGHEGNLTNNSENGILYRTYDGGGSWLKVLSVRSPYEPSSVDDH